MTALKPGSRPTSDIGPSRSLRSGIRLMRGRGPLTIKIPADRLVLGIGPVVVVVAVLACLGTGLTSWSTDVPPWALGVASVALLFGVPHGAVDHLTSRVPWSRRTRCLLGVGYLGVAGAVTGLIVMVPAPLFVLVLGMSVWHFGTGDIEAIHDLSRSRPGSRAARRLHVLALGCTPVLLPLTSAAAISSVGMIHPALLSVLTPTSTILVRVLVLCLVLLVLVLLLHGRDVRGAGELALLVVLGLVATPLVAFAVYFASWHALRHTARLALSPEGNLELSEVLRVFLRGVPALVVTIVGVFVVITVSRTGSSVDQYLWIGLAVVWGLTVPHMIAISRYDRSRRARMAELP